MSTYRALVLRGMRAVALIGILPGAIVAAAYLLVLTGHLYQGWDARTALVLGMAVWGVLGVLELWHQYVRLSRERPDAERPPVSPRVVLLVWALILVPPAVWKADTHPWVAGFLVVVALYSFGRALGLERYFTRRTAASPGTVVAGASPVARARVRERSRALAGQRSRARTPRAAAASPRR
jgi:hypothetical protein